MTPIDYIGRQVDQYFVLELIAQGGAGNIFLAEDLTTHAEVVLKIILHNAFDPTGMAKRAHYEIEAISRIHHPHIIPVYGYGIAQDLVYIAMRYIAGGSLQQRIQAQPMPVRQACIFARQVALALQAAHAQRVIHRDVKPANILIDHGQRAYLTDFGISRVYGVPPITRVGATIGTPEYMAPEQAKGEEIDYRADIYALGCVLHHMLAGMPPFAASSQLGIAYKQVHEPPPPLRTIVADIPRELESAVLRALEKHPEDRYVSANVFAVALAPFCL